MPSMIAVALHVRIAERIMIRMMINPLRYATSAASSTATSMASASVLFVPHAANYAIRWKESRAIAGIARDAMRFVGRGSRAAVDNYVTETKLRYGT